MEFMGSQGELSSGYKLVPWSSWDQWHFVRESLFSSSPASVSRALQRVNAWRSRGCLPVPIDVTAAIVEIQQKDPFFRAESKADELNSEELLAMLYCMAIMRLVNCFVEPAHKTTGRSISDLADVVGIPRMLVDIRHESSHRDLPSIQLVRTASVKALDWLKCNYWEPQRNMIPDVRREVKCRLREMSFYLKNKHAQRSSSSQGCKKSGMLMRCNRLSSQIAGKRWTSKSDASSKRIHKSVKIIARLYSSYPSEVVAVLLDFFRLQEPDFSDVVNTECSDVSDVDDLGPRVGAMNDLKTIITKLSKKRPGLILSILKAVLEMIEAKESNQSENGGWPFHSSKSLGERADTSRLCTLVHWLILNLKSLKDLGRIGVIGDSVAVSLDTKACPDVSLTNLLSRILSLSVVNDEHLSRSALLLGRMIGNNSLTEKFKKLPLLRTQEQDFTDESSFHDIGKMLLQEAKFIKQATEKLEFLKLKLKSRSRRLSSADGPRDATSRRWTVAKSWTPCPMGMLPCSFGSTGVLPPLDKTDGYSETDKNESNMDHVVDDLVSEKRGREDGDADENQTAMKRLRTSEEDDEEMGLLEIASPTEGCLLIGGVWKKVSEEELLDIESRIGSFAESLPVRS